MNKLFNSLKRFVFLDDDNDVGHKIKAWLEDNNYPKEVYTIWQGSYTTQ